MSGEWRYAGEEQRGDGVRFCDTARMGAVDVSTEVAIDCPPSKVSAFAADPDNAPTWYVNIKNVEWKTVRRVAVGSRIAYSSPVSRTQFSSYRVPSASCQSRPNSSSSEVRRFGFWS